MNIYTVTVKHLEAHSTEPDAFAMINFGEDGYSEFERFDSDGNEIYTIHTERDIDRALDLSDGVISYTVTEIHPDNEEIDEELRQLADDSIFDDYPETEQEANRF